MKKKSKKVEIPKPETVIRAFELPMGGAGKDILDSLRKCWDEGSMFANWAVQQLQRADTPRTPSMATAKDWPKPVMPALYNLAFVRKEYPGSEFFSGAAASATCILKKAQDKYFSERFAVLWARTQGAFSTYRSMPWPVKGQAWRGASFDEAGKPVVRFSLPLVGMVELRLRGGPEFARQIGLFRQVVEGSLPKKELAIRWQPIGDDSSHRPTCWVRGQPGRVMVKMVAELPTREPFGGRVMTLCVEPGAFWAAELDGRRAWIANHDHVRRAMEWLGAHHDRLQRLRQDAKAELRCEGKPSRAWARSVERLTLKHKNRMASWLHEMASHAVGFAERNRVGELCYDDAGREGLTLFPWFRLKTVLADKCAAAGIRFRDMTAHAPQEDSYSEALEQLQGA